MFLLRKESKGKKKKQKETGTFTQYITTVESVIPWCEASVQELLSFALLASEQAQKTENVIDRCCSSVSRKCRLLSTVTRLISSESSSSDEIMPCSQSSREHWVRRFFAVGPISTLGLVGDSGRTVRSLSAASKPRITQRLDMRIV